jgi:hypothetical protein
MDVSQATSPATGEQQTAAGAEADGSRPGFGARGRMRRRARFLRKARELAYRDLGGLVYSLHRFGKRNDGLVLAKLETIGRIDNELRALEDALQEREPVTVLREAGVAACARCAAIHGSEDRFCPNCGLAMDLRAERPMAGAPVSTSGGTETTAGGATGPTQTAPSPTAPSAPVPASAAGVSPGKETGGDEGVGRVSPAPESSPVEMPTEQQAAPAGPAPAVEEPTEIIRPSVKSP